MKNISTYDKNIETEYRSMLPLEYFERDAVQFWLKISSIGRKSKKIDEPIVAIPPPSLSLSRARASII